MTTTGAPQRAQRVRALLLGRDIDDRLLQLRGLVLVRELLAERGASRAEIEAHDAALRNARRELADVILGHGRGEQACGEAAA